MDTAWVRLRTASDTRPSPSRSYRVLRPREDRPQAVDLFTDDPGLPDAFRVHANPVVDGDGAVAFVAVLYRRPDVDHAFFSRYWAEQHAVFGPRIPHARSYVQLHADDGAPVDGVCVVAFDSVDELRAGMRADVVAVDARADEELFIDHGRSYALVCAPERE